MNFRYVIKELRHHHHRTLVNVLGIAIGIALFVSINAVSTAYQKAVSLPFKNLGADLVVQKPEKRAVDAAQTPASMRGIRLPFSNQLLPAEELRKLAPSTASPPRPRPCSSGSSTGAVSGRSWASTSPSRAWGRSR